MSALVKSIKRVRDPALPLEWRGGVLGMVIDEAVLNTRQYADARAFLRHNYFLAAIVSLPRDAFADLAKTTAKTSILLLVRKEDPSVIQREPVFFARAVAAGPSGRDISRRNDLVPFCDAFNRWRAAVFSACGQSGGALAPAQAAAASAAMRAGIPESLQIGLWLLDPGRATERLDEAYWCMKDLVTRLPATIPLSTVASLIESGRTPPSKDIYPFAVAGWLDSRVRPKAQATTNYTATELKTLHEGDIVISGIDLIHGGVGVVEKDCAGMVVSKEYYVLRAKEGVDAHWLVSLLRAPAMRRIVEGIVTGTSNRNRVESSDVLMSLPIPPPPDADDQKMIGDRLRHAHEHQRHMQESIAAAEAQAAEKAGLAVLTTSDEPTDEAA